MDPALPTPQRHSFLQPELALMSMQTNFTQREKKEGKSKTRGRDTRCRMFRAGRGPRLHSSFPVELE